MLNHMLRHLRPKVESGEDLTPEEEKKQRVQWHRDHVRNGPQNWRTLTSGQVRRQHARDAKSRQRKTNKRYRRAWMAQQREIATLRGHLIVLGVLECKHAETAFTDAQRQTSLMWVVQKYGLRDDDGRIVADDAMVPDAVTAAREAFLQLQKVPA